MSPFARRRGERTRAALRDAGVELHGHAGLNAIDDVGSPRTQAGRPYTVFTPFHRSWEQQERRAVLGAPRSLPALPSGLAKGRIPSLASLGLRQEVDEPPRRRRAPRARAAVAFLAARRRRLRQGRDALGDDASSRLSPYLHFGCVSAREVESRLGSGAGPEAFRRQLCWRDFHHHVLLHFPRNARSEFQQRYRGKIAGAARSGASRAGVRGGRAFRWSTPACASCAARAGCTTARGWSSARS